MLRTVSLALALAATLLVGCGDVHRFSDASFPPNAMPSSPTVNGVTLRLQKVALGTWSFTVWAILENEGDKPFALDPNRPLELELCKFPTLPEINIDDGTNRYRQRHKRPTPIVIPPHNAVKLKLYAKNSTSSFGPAFVYKDHEDWAVIAHPDPGMQADDLIVTAGSIPVTTPTATR